jgi:hypothetical protein
MNTRLAIPLLLILGCTATNSQPAAAPATTSPAGFKNLKVLPRDISREQLLTVMRTFTRSLGVKCNHCHVATATTPKEVLDFPSDAKEEKRVARVMIQMTRQINEEWLERVEQAEGDGEADEAPAATGTAELTQPRVGCWTCHRGHAEPEMPPPPPPPAAPPAPTQ